MVEPNRENSWEHLMLWNTDKSLFAFIVRTHHCRRREFVAMARDPRWAHLTFIRLCSVAEVGSWLDGVPNRIRQATTHHGDVALDPQTSAG